VLKPQALPYIMATFTSFTERLVQSAPNRKQAQDLKTGEMILNLGPQHPSTHGVLRLEVVTDGELVIEVVPHLGYMHRCFEKHCESLSYQQIIPYVDRLDYLAAMNSEHAYVMAVEQALGITQEIPPRVEYIRVLVAELNRIASHLLAIGTYGIDIGAVTSFLWCLRDREHILNLLEWVSGARLLYNYMQVGGLMFDLPVGFEDRAESFCEYFRPKVDELETLLGNNPIFVQRTANIGVIPLTTAVNYGLSGPMLRASGLRYDLRRIKGYSVYPELAFDVPIGTGKMGTVGDCWDRFEVRLQEIRQSIGIVEQCAERLRGPFKRTPDFDPRAYIPKKLRAPEPLQDGYFSAENPRGELGFYIVPTAKSEIPFRLKARGPSFCNLSILPAISQNVLIADLVAIVGSIDIVLCEVDR
jgi:NADH-quinone oxidoreductase subunit D